MGTRGLMGFRKNSVDKLTYNHWDNYPSGVGIDILSILKKTTINKLNEVFDRIILVEEHSKPTEKEIKECEKWSNLKVSTQVIDDWYCLLRNVQGDIDSYIEGGLRYMIDSKDFIRDSLFCEWGYIINLDKNVLEVWVGFQNIPNKDRYSKLGAYESHSGENYYPCRLQNEFDLNNLPSEEEFESLCNHPYHLVEGKDEN